MLPCEETEIKILREIKSRLDIIRTGDSYNKPKEKFIETSRSWTASKVIKEILLRHNYYNNHGLSKDSVQDRSILVSLMITLVIWLAIGFFSVVRWCFFANVNWVHIASNLLSVEYLMAIFAQLFGTFWGVYTVFYKEFSEKYSHLNRLHDSLVKDGIDIDSEYEVQWVNFAEDCLLYKMHFHESFYPTFRKIVVMHFFKDENDCLFDCPRLYYYLQCVSRFNRKRREFYYLGRKEGCIKCRYQYQKFGV